jgi:hypothetical protein
MTDDEQPEATVERDDGKVVRFPLHPSRKTENELRAELDDASLIRRQRRDYTGPRPCDHKHAKLDEPNRRVYCADCEVELDPIAVLDMIAAEADRYISSIQLYHRRMRELQGTVADLERAERNAKSRIRNARKRRDDREALAAAAAVWRMPTGTPFEDLSADQQEGMIRRVQPICEAYLAALT